MVFAQIFCFKTFKRITFILKGCFPKRSQAANSDLVAGHPCLGDETKCSRSLSVLLDVFPFQINLHLARAALSWL